MNELQLKVQMAAKPIVASILRSSVVWRRMMAIRRGMAHTTDTAQMIRTFLAERIAFRVTRPALPVAPSTACTYNNN